MTGGTGTTAAAIGVNSGYIGVHRQFHQALVQVIGLNMMFLLVRADKGHFGHKICFFGLGLFLRDGDGAGGLDLFHHHIGMGGADAFYGGEFFP